MRTPHYSIKWTFFLGPSSTLTVQNSLDNGMPLAHDSPGTATDTHSTSHWAYNLFDSEQQERALNGSSMHQLPCLEISEVGTSLYLRWHKWCLHHRCSTVYTVPGM